MEDCHGFRKRIVVFLPIREEECITSVSIELWFKFPPIIAHTLVADIGHLAIKLKNLDNSKYHYSEMFFNSH